MNIPPKYANIPPAYLFNQTIPPGIKETLLQAYALAWQNKYTWVRLIGVDFEELTGKDTGTVYHHLLQLRKSGLVTFSSPATCVWDVLFLAPEISNTGNNAEKDSRSDESPNVNLNSSSSDLVVNSSARDALARHYSGRGDFDLAKWPEDTREVVEEFCKLWHMTPPSREKDRAAWISDCRELLNRCGKFTIPAMQAERRAFEDYMSKHQGIAPYTIGGLRSILNTVNTQAGKLRQADEQKPEEGKGWFYA